MGKCCWIAKLSPNFIFQSYRPQTWQSYLFFPVLSVSGIHQVLGIKFRVGRSRDFSTTQTLIRVLK